jgi:hypothetical protein
MLPNRVAVGRQKYQAHLRLSNATTVTVSMVLCPHFLEGGQSATLLTQSAHAVPTTRHSPPRSIRHTTSRANVRHVTNSTICQSPQYNCTPHNSRCSCTTLPSLKEYQIVRRWQAAHCLLTRGLYSSSYKPISLEHGAAAGLPIDARSGVFSSQPPRVPVARLLPRADSSVLATQPSVDPCLLVALQPSRACWGT